LFKSRTSPIISICVGNIRVGGTGKSPFVEYLLCFAKNKKIKTGTLSRGYGRKTKGFIHANANSTSTDIGDESLQYLKKFGPEIPVFVGENRVKAIEKIKSNFNDLKLIILDDAFQHRALKANYNILLSEYSRPFYDDYLLPFGMLREARNGAKRADCIIVTKCPSSISESDMKFVETRTRTYSTLDTPIFFTKINYSEPKKLFPQNTSEIKITNVILISGIDNPQPFFDFCREKYHVLDQIVFPDHHSFSENEVLNFINKLKNETNCIILTTEKDTSRLLTYSSLLSEIAVYYLPIEVKFIKNEEIFLSLLDGWISA